MNKQKENGMHASPARVMLLTSLIGGLPLLLLWVFADAFYFVMDTPSYLFFHNVAEFFSVMVSLSIFGVAWYSYDQSGNRHALFVGTAFLCVGLLDFMHAQGYSGMPAFVTANTPLKSTEYWIAGRFYAAMAVLLSAYIYSTSRQRWLTKSVLLAVNLALPLLVFFAITYFPEYIPATYVEGVGLTPFKTYTEYLIIGLLAWSAVVYWKRLAQTQEQWVVYLLAALILSMFSESQFASYQRVYDSYNVIGHLYKIAAFYLIYLGIFATSVKQPYVGMLRANEQLQDEVLERQRAEVNLSASEHKLLTILDNVDAYIYLKDKEGRYLFANQAVRSLWHAEMKDIVGCGDEKFFDAATAANIRLNDRRVLEGGETLRADEINTLPGGETFSYQSIKLPLRSENGGIYALCGISVDITKRLQEEQELRENAASLKEAQRIAGVGSYVMNLHTGVWESSDVLDQVLGIDKNYMRSLEGWNALIHPDDRLRVESYLSSSVISCSNTIDQEFRIVRHNDQAERWVHGLGKLEFDAQGRLLKMKGTIQDITEKKKAEERIERLAHFDQLTDLPNRILLNDRFKYALTLAQRSNEQLTVMFLDLDHFKDINDTLGHSVGDRLLSEVARRIKSVVREEDTVARLGGDEFILILPDTDADGAAQVAANLIDVISLSCQIERHELNITPSIGIAIYPHDGESPEILSKNADIAMYRVKQRSRNDFCFFAAEMQTHSSRKLLLSNALRHALERDELQLHYQPKISIEDGHVTGAEALLRWRHPELGMISPAEFIPIAESGGQIIQIGEWVLRTAVKQLKDWIDSGLPPLIMAVNLSTVQFRQQGLPELVTRILDEHKLAHEYLELELTEAAAMDDPQAAVQMMDRLHEKGVRMSIDDFGTGYSSLSYLKKFKVHTLKIDQSFVRDIIEDPDDKAIVNAIINMASSLGIHTIAEGVETADQLAFLRLHGCNEVQGYYFSKPLPAAQFEAYLKKNS